MKTKAQKEDILLEDKIALKLNELVAKFMSYNDIMTIQDYDDLMLKSESEVGK